MPLTGLEDLPEFDLTYQFDDATDPSEVTVFPDAETPDRTTAWITADAESAVSIEEIR